MVLSSPALGADGILYVGGNDGKVYALNGKTGAKNWEFEGGGAPSSPALGADGILYVSSGSKVYAIQTDSKGLAKSPWPMLGQNPQHTGRAPKK
jgi:outer membrane protein assembly factor BamB